MKPLPASLPCAAPDFDGLARLYRWMEWFSFGPWLWRCRCAFLHSLGDRRQALVLGDGDGRFTARLLRECPSAEVDAVDASRAMLEALLRRAGGEQVRTFCADARTWQPARPTYDLVITHFFLDCLTTGEVEAVAMKIRAAAAPDALWIVSEFAVPEGWFGRSVARPVVGGLYRAFGLLTGLGVRTLPDHRNALQKAGFRLVRQRTFLRGLLAGECWQPAGSLRMPEESAIS